MVLYILYIEHVLFFFLAALRCQFSMNHLISDVSPCSSDWCNLFCCEFSQGEFPSVEDMTAAERALHEMRALIRLMQEEVAKAQEKKKKDQEEEEQRRKQVELQVQQEAQKKAAQSAKEKVKERKGEIIVRIQDHMLWVTDIT